jgi:hypothetical protein
MCSLNNARPSPEPSNGWRSCQTDADHSSSISDIDSGRFPTVSQNATTPLETCQHADATPFPLLNWVRDCPRDCNPTSDPAHTRTNLSSCGKKYDMCWIDSLRRPCGPCVVSVLTSHLTLLLLLHRYGAEARDLIVNSTETAITQYIQNQSRAWEAPTTFEPFPSYPAIRITYVVEHIGYSPLAWIDTAVTATVTGNDNVTGANYTYIDAFPPDAEILPPNTTWSPPTSPSGTPLFDDIRISSMSFVC